MPTTTAIVSESSFSITESSANVLRPGLGTQAVAALIAAPGFSTAGYVNVATPDSVVHGQVKQSAHFSYVRVYESGHEVPFYQPVIALSIFERAIEGKDIATGKVVVTSGYKTLGPSESTYREGNATIQFAVLPADATYNTTTNAPNPPGKRTRPERFAKRRGRFGR